LIGKSGVVFYLFFRRKLCN